LRVAVDARHPGVRNDAPYEPGGER
jgi:hypothetical protein